MEITQNAIVVSSLLLKFTIYSFIGWTCESIYCSVPAKKWINRGFLNGPFCPVYGVGALLVIFLLRPFSNNIFLLFVCGMLVTSVLEYLTGFLLEKLFHTTWWDYSKRRFNIQGRVCLLNSLMFGALSVILIYLINPFVEKLEGVLPSWLLPWAAFFIVLYFITDSVVTVRSILTLNGKLDELETVLDEIKKKGEEEREKIHQSFESKVSATREAVLGLESTSKEHLRERLETMSQTLNSGAQRRLLRAFPGMSSSEHRESISHMKEAVQRRRQKRNKKEADDASLR